MNLFTLMLVHWFNSVSAERGLGCRATRVTRKAALAAVVVLSGCREATVPPGEPGSQAKPPPAIVQTQKVAGPVSGLEWTEERVHQVLREHNPAYNNQAMAQLEDGQVVALQLSGTGVTNLAGLRNMRLIALDLRQTRVSDLDPLRGLPLEELYAEECLVEDLAPLEGMKLVKLYLSKTPVRDLRPLRGMPLRELNLLGTAVTDLSPLSAAPLEMLWLNETPVADIVALRACPLVSLTLHRTQVIDLSPLAGTSLQRLHIGETPVHDLTPLRGLGLTRLVFTPHRITRGLEVAREMSSLSEIGPSLESVMPPAQFWRMHAEGAFD